MPIGPEIRGRISSLYFRAPTAIPYLLFSADQNLDFLEEEIRAVPEYIARFKHVFGTEDITRKRIAMAIAAPKL